MTNVSSFQALNRFKKLRVILPAVSCLIIVSFFLIGGCNDSGTNPSGEARTIGNIDGAVVPAIKAEFILERWGEGDPDGDIFLNGSRVSGLTQPEKDALNSAYQSGFFVSLISPETQDMNDLLVVLGLQPLIQDNRPVDLYAVSREFDVSGVRHFTIDTLDDVNEDNPPGLRFHIERVERLITWAINQPAVTTSTRQDGSPTTELTALADSTSYTKVFSFPSGLNVIKVNNMFTGSLSDYFLHTTTTLQGWGVHSEGENSDFYFFQVQNEFAPNTTLTRVQPDNLWPCQVQQPPSPNGIPSFFRNGDLRGNRNIFTTNIVTDFSSDNVQNLDSEPKTTVGTTSTSSTLSTMVGGNVSYSSENGAGVGLSESVTYSNTQSYSASAVQIDNESLEGPAGNNATWNYDISNPNTVFGVATNSFLPQGQWELKADSSTRAGGQFNITTGFRLEVILITCATNPGVLHNIPAPNVGSGLVGWSLNFPVPPLPPPPTTCTDNADCPVGQVCGTDLMPPVCVPQPCDESMTCPAGFDCMNEVCVAE
ncbi:MAG: hypothetical protein DHS20C13_17420 [Thermodesulfobacteriota bacterium]|nr:MAG: hypothetical protein DHS20C13_17420 [Thermodesulfobacteriota bacterium]